MQEALDRWIVTGLSVFAHWMTHPSSWVLLFGVPIVSIMFHAWLTTRKFWHNEFHDAKTILDCRSCLERYLRC